MKPLKIYVASSWRNQRQPHVVETLRRAGHQVYDFRNPRNEDADTGFHWTEVDGGWKSWTPEKFRAALRHPIAQKGFTADLQAMEWADAFVLVMPCGRSAHLEAGWAIGAGKPTYILLSDGEPELMYKLATGLCLSVDELIKELS